MYIVRCLTCRRFVYAHCFLSSLVFEPGDDPVRLQTTEALTSHDDPCPSISIPDKADETRLSPGRRLPPAAKTETTASQFGKSMIDDEKRRARADLLGLNAGGRSIGASSWQHKSRSLSRDVKQRGRSEDDDVIVIED
jgi:hypothetical protein